MKLIFTNCYSFNGFDHVLSKNAMVLENILKRDAPILHAKEEELRLGKQGGDTPVVKKAKPAPSVNISPEKAELRKYRHVLDKLAHHPTFYAFGAPVDPVLLKIPTYFEIIKRPMDFGTIRKKFDKNRYETTNDLLADVKQVFVNCYLFNVPDDVVSKMGKELETEFIRLCKAKDLPTIQVSRPAPTHT
jgi:transcription initiation factor TFIID subunit 2